MIPLAPEVLFNIWKFPVTNTILDTLLTDVILLSLVYVVSRNIKILPGMLQNIIEFLFEQIYNITNSVAAQRTGMIFPFFMTFFLFILISNWSGLLPALGAIGFYHGKTFYPLLRSASTDLNATIAFALISLSATHYLSIKTLGFKEYITRFISYKPLNLYVGLLELISEFTKIISFSFRLFGNIYVGEVMISQLSNVSAFLLPIPLMLYESAVGLIQALVFGMLTMAFMAILTTPHSEGGEL